MVRVHEGHDPQPTAAIIDSQSVLYLPQESWMAEQARCAAAGVSPELTFKTRPVQVQEMIEAARAAGVGFAWFTADEEFGQNPGLCDYLETSRIPYVMAVRVMQNPP